VKKEEHDSWLVILCMLLVWALILAWGNLEMVAQQGMSKPCVPLPPPVEKRTT
jgi:hypothetical protein